MQDCHELKNLSLNDKCSIKQITECIDDIVQVNSTIFSSPNLTSGSWQMQINTDLQHLIAFTFPRNLDQFTTLLFCPFSMPDYSNP